MEGFVPASELDSEIKRSTQETIYSTGSTLVAKIIRIDDQSKRIILSVKRVAEDAERADIEKYVQSKAEDATDSLGEKFSGLFSKLKFKD